MAHAPATDDAIEIVRATPSLGVGCHVVLLDGEPILSPSRDLPHLTHSTTRQLRSSLSDFLLWLYGPASRSGSRTQFASEIQAEAAAQIDLLQNSGVHLTHIDTHKHVHMFPAVLRPVLRAARAAGIRSVRNPFEPAWSLHATLQATPHAPLLRRTQVTLLRRLEPAFRRIVAEEGFTTTDGAIGVLATGSLDASTLAALLRPLPPGTWELVAHPGYNDADLARIPTRLRSSRDIERVALEQLRQFPNIELVSFASAFAPSAQPPTS